MTGDETSRAEAFLAALVELDPGPAQLKRDPEGATWLPKVMQSQAAADPQCAEALRDFVETEMALFDLDPAGPGAAALFTRDVVERLPPRKDPDPRKRRIILMATYSVALLAALGIVVPLLGLSGGSVIEGMHGLVGEARSAAGSAQASSGVDGLGQAFGPSMAWGVLVLAALTAAVLTFLGTRRRGRQAVRPDGAAPSVSLG